MRLIFKVGGSLSWFEGSISNVRGLRSQYHLGEDNEMRQKQDHASAFITLPHEPYDD